MHVTEPYPYVLNACQWIPKGSLQHVTELLYTIARKHGIRNPTILLQISSGTYPQGTSWVRSIQFISNFMELRGSCPNGIKLFLFMLS